MATDWLDEEDEWLDVVLEAELSEDGDDGDPIDLPEAWPWFWSNSFSFIADIIFSNSAEEES